MTSPSGPALFAKALSAIGGVYAFIDGAFALIFRRTMLAILFGEFVCEVGFSSLAKNQAGSEIVLPFRFLGIVTRDRFRRLINEQFPHMQDHNK